MGKREYETAAVWLLSVNTFEKLHCEINLVTFHSVNPCGLMFATGIFWYRSVLNCFKASSPLKNRYVMACQTFCFHVFAGICLEAQYLPCSLCRVFYLWRKMELLLKCALLVFQRPPSYLCSAWPCTFVTRIKKGWLQVRLCPFSVPVWPVPSTPHPSFLEQWLVKALWSEWSD